LAARTLPEVGAACPAPVCAVSGFLRPYQAALVELLRQSYRTGHEAPLLQLATGAGKTWILCAVIAGAIAKGIGTLVRL
jgi:superfamily II DNA or RNA helicase